MQQSVAVSAQLIHILSLFYCYTTLNALNTPLRIWCMAIAIGRSKDMKNQATSQTKQMQHVVPRTTPWRLTPAWRKAVLVLHVVAGIGWMGVDIALLVLLITARTTDDAALVVSGFNAIGMIVPIAVPPLSLSILVTGIILGLGTRWGLVRYWWVLVKLLLSLIMTVLVFVSLVPTVRGIAVLSTTTISADAVRASLGTLPTMLMFPPVVSFLMLGTAAILSIFKPWRRTPWSRESGSEAMQDV
jgi:hypothetical protein